MSGERGEISPVNSAPEGVAQNAAPVFKGAELQNKITFSPAEAANIQREARQTFADRAGR